ncbi:histidine kinase [Catenulispora acidiphila DSM 44928]|uniref:histidine kinase n=1 Tax=Catenulispora acidiphila (strain DSM 44928 / JCM 14897 / NBRC 102108 / NRRL B-24433 / ID139908) TaxID=479433 RepID=C7QEE5_CATAD|nr:sensor domain-containing protein [Catenulispora acidiphila]ACU70836.1 histidine kinase [Catenulispora acidiphila DSM 44928]
MAGLSEVVGGGAGAWRERGAATALAVGRGLVLAPVSLLAGIPLLVAAALTLGLMPIGGGVLVPYVIRAVRGLATWERGIAARWSGVEIEAPYLPRAGRGRLRWLLGDPATWRDLLWMVTNIPVGMALGLLPLTLAGWGVVGVIAIPGLALSDDPFWPFGLGFGLVALALAPFVGPALIRAQALWASTLLAPTDVGERISTLTVTRERVSDDAEAEMRRIERDLHDGAQARLAAVGLSLGMAEDLVRENPDEAIALLAEAREHSGAALAELRSLVRGILPPVLAERGLGDALRALAYASPIPVEVRSDLTERLPAPRESALYFGIAEALANVLKHSGAARARIDVFRREDRITGANGVVAEVWDDGDGGADPDRGEGLSGVRRRLAAFDGRLTVVSPAGGPTTVTLEVPGE